MSPAQAPKIGGLPPVTTKLEALGFGAKRACGHRPDNLRGAGRQADPISSSLAVYSDQVAQKSRAGANAPAAARYFQREPRPPSVKAFGPGDHSEIAILARRSLRVLT